METLEKKGITKAGNVNDSQVSNSVQMAAIEDLRQESQNNQALQMMVKDTQPSATSDIAQLNAQQDLEKNSWGALEKQAQAALPKFSDIFDQLVKSTGAKTDKYQKIKMKMVDNPEKKGTKVRRWEHSEHSLSEVAPLKGQARADQKAKGKYKGDYSNILDVVRGTLTFGDFKGLIDALKIVHANEQGLGYEVVRCKQTYQDSKGQTGAQTLYGDIKMNLKEKSTGHVCELQFTLHEFMKVKQKGHKSYKEMRNANPFGDKVLDAKKGADNATSGHITHAIHGSYAAYTAARIAIEKDASGLQEAIATANDIQKQVAAAEKNDAPAEK